MTPSDMKLLNVKRAEIMDIVPKVLKLSGEPDENHSHYIQLALSDIDDSLTSYRLLLRGLENETIN